MIRGVSYSCSRAVACAVAGCALAAAGALRHHTAGVLSARIRHDSALEAALGARIAGLGPCEASDLEELRGRVRGIRSQLGAPDTWERLARLLGGAWAAGPLKRDDRDGYSNGAGSVSLRQPSISDWPAIVDAMRVIETVPGARVVGFEMRTSGDRERRVVDLVSVAVSTQTESLPAQPRTP